jgi:hypothetical protein
VSEETRKSAQEATKFFKEVSEKADKFQKAIPDRQLHEKLKKVSESATEVVKHITEKSGKEG